MEPIERQAEIRRTVKISTIEGTFAQAHFALAAAGSVFLTRFAVLLQATPMHFSVLSAISQVSQLFQLLGVAITRRTTSRKGAVLRLITVGRALPLAPRARAGPVRPGRAGPVEHADPAFLDTRTTCPDGRGSIGLPRAGNP
jgi:hypothetical protein